MATSLVRKDFPLPQDSVHLLQVVHSSIGIRGQPGKNIIYRVFFNCLPNFSTKKKSLYFDTLITTLTFFTAVIICVKGAANTISRPTTKRTRALVVVLTISFAGKTQSAFTALVSSIADQCLFLFKS